MEKQMFSIVLERGCGFILPQFNFLWKTFSTSVGADFTEEVIHTQDLVTCGQKGVTYNDSVH